MGYYKVSQGIKTAILGCTKSPERHRDGSTNLSWPRRYANVAARGTLFVRPTEARGYQHRFIEDRH